MNDTKKLQILLMLAAVLCAAGILASLFGGDEAMPRNFRPPEWISALEWLAILPMMFIPAVAYGKEATATTNAHHLGGKSQEHVW